MKPEIGLRSKFFSKFLNSLKRNSIKEFLFFLLNISLAKHDVTFVTKDKSTKTRFKIEFKTKPIAQKRLAKDRKRATKKKAKDKS